MEVVARLIMAKNPKVKLFRIGRGESLGAKRLKAIVDFAKKNGYQGFIEQVVRGQNELVVTEYNEK
jgi:fatty acid/phospholipid biosynthesis enzyme